MSYDSALRGSNSAKQSKPVNRRRSTILRQSAWVAAEVMERRQLLSTVLFTDNYGTDTSANYTETAQTAPPNFVDSWTVDTTNGTLNYAISANNGWNSSVFLTKPTVASTSGLAVSQTSGDLIKPVNYQAGLVLSGDPTNGGFVVAEYDNGIYANHLVLLRETGGQLTGDEGGVGNPPVLADYGDISAINMDTFHVTGTIDRTGSSPVITVSITDTTTSTVIANNVQSADTADPANYGGNLIGWRARYQDATAAFSVDNLELDNPFPTATSGPAAPSNLTANQVTATTTVNLSWTNNATNAAQLDVERAPVGTTNFVTIGIVGPTATTFTDTLNGAPGAQFVYRVRAINGFNGVSSASSNIAGPVTVPSNIGVEGHYYNVAFWAGTPTVSTQVLTVNQNWPNGSPDPAIRASNNSTVFTGKVHADVAGTYTFISNTDDDGYLYVDGQLVSEDPGGHGTRNATSVVAISLAANTDYDFVLLQSQGGGGAGANMLWVTPGATAPVIVPSDHLKPVSDTPQAPSNLGIDPNGGQSPNPNPHAVDFVFDSNNNAVVKYLLQRRPGSSTSESDWTTVNSTDPQGTLQDFSNAGEFTIHIEDASALPGTSYQYRVESMNFDHTSAPSNTVNVSTPALPAQAPGVEARFFNGELATGPADPRNIMVNGNPGEFQADSFGVLNGGGSTLPIDANFGNSSPDATNYPDIPRIHVDDFATLFTGKIRTDLAGTYTFVTNSDDDGYMWVNDVLVSSDPGGHGQRNAPNIVPISLAANTEYDFILIQQEQGGGAAVHASWSEPDGMGGSTVLATIPANTPGGAGGFEMNMDAPNKQTIDPTSGAIVTDNTQSAATNLVLRASTAAGNTLSWTDQSFSEVWFQIERATVDSSGNAGPFSVVGKAGFDTSSFTDTTAVAGTHYNYRIRGMNFDAQGTASSVLDTANGVTLQVPTLTAVGCVPNEVELTFTGQSPNSGGFELQYHDNTSSTFIDVPGASALPNNTTNYSVTGLDPTKTYTFQVRNLAGPGAPNASAYSNTASASAAGSPTLDHSTGFTGATDIHTNGNSSITTVGTNTVLQITPQQNNQVGSAYDVNQQGVLAFDTSFDFQFNQGASTPGADGFTFVIQGGAITAIGGGGGALGYQNIGTKSLAVKFDLWNGGPADSTTGVYTAGEAVNDNLSTTPGVLHTGYSMEASGIKFHTNFADTFRANLKYDGTTLSETVTDLTTNAVFTMSWAVNIPQIVGGPCAFVGFTGATGGANAEQDILNWKFTSLAANHPHLPADFNGDGQQNFADLLILAQNYGAHPATFAMGDANGDGTVNFPDLLILAQNYGKTSAAAPAAAASASSLDLLASARKAKPLARKR